MLRRHNQKIEDEKKHQMVPFREAKLTRLIKTFFRQLQQNFLSVSILVLFKFFFSNKSLLGYVKQ
jgi:hypothetical protein